MPHNVRGETCGQADLMTIDKVCEQCWNLGKDVSILDVSAGSGRIAWEFIKRGFVHLDALEACEENINALRQKALYDRYFQCDESYKEFPIADCVYDVVVYVQVSRDKKITNGTVRQLVRVTKHGGLVVMCLNRNLSGEEQDINLETIMMELQTDNVWECLSRHVIAETTSKTDILYTFRKV
ncbi:Williams-Beuren syndrome chromosomal region 27 protein [Biomphalaria glabrata]|nr:methyltransferase-like protein 27 [Biomphalaria glabrata]